VEGTNVTRAAVLEELAKIGFADAGQVMAQGTLTPESLQSLPPRLLASVASLEKTASGVKLKFYDKLKALELLGKAVGAFESQPEGDPRGSELLTALLECTGKEADFSAIQELHPAADDRPDLVESAKAKAL